jgi:group I intron endonuclease
MEASIGLSRDVPGIYVIQNMENGKVYIGSSKHIKTRGKQHLSALRNNSHTNKHLQRAWNLYGESSFAFMALITFLPEWLEMNNLIDEEDRYLEIHNSFSYNMSRASQVFDWSGRKHSLSTRLKMSKAAIPTRKRKLSDSDVIDIRKMSVDKISYAAIAKKYKIATSTVYKIVKRKKWKHI